MSYNYWIEKKEFDRKWEIIRKKYEEAGMAEEDIEKMYQYDYERFKADRLYRQRTEFIEPSEYDPREDCSSKLPLEKISDTDDKLEAHSRYWWVEDIEDSRLAAYIKRLSELELEILTLYAFYGYDQKNIAEMLGVSQQLVSKKIVKTKQTLEILKKVW